MATEGGAAITLPPPFSLAAYDCVVSTNDEAKRLAGVGAAAGLVVWAREQSGGRGRLDRRWISPRGNLFASVLLRPSVAPAMAAQLSFVAAIAVVDVARSLLPEAVALVLKWPNDVLADGGKLSGILLEARSDPSGQLEWVVLGIGINVAAAPIADYPTACLSRLAGHAIQVSTVLERLVHALAVRIEAWSRQGFAPIRLAWLAHAAGLGAALDIRQGGAILAGKFVDLDLDGALVLETPSGLRRVTAGDVHFQAR
jgi:BirA family transcriptional regulator, biotin operon repressor / biotin---[acetyl-CoA-carboxylase] ligase